MRHEQYIVLGAGFGGLRAARTLAKAGLPVLLIDQHNYHCFQPLLYQVATAGLESEQIAYPIRGIIRRWSNVRFLMARVNQIDFDRRCIETTNGLLSYDHLIIAAGSASNDFGLPGVAEHGFGLKTLDDAERLRNHILTMFERADVERDSARRQTMRTFVIVGGGPTGVEFAGALRELVKHVLVRDFRHLDERDVQVILLEATDTVLAMLPPKLQRKTIARLQQMGVDVRCQSSVVRVEADCVYLKDGTTIPARTLLWAAGVRGVDLEYDPALALARGKRIPVQPDLSLAAYSDVYVIGDLAYLEDHGRPYPQVAQVAIQQGETAARNIIRRSRGQQPQPFSYRDLGTMATIGRNAAVAHIFGLSLSGFVAWLIWLFVHLMALVGFRNRVVVLVNWAYNYIFYEQAIRLITGPGKPHLPM